MGCLGRIHVFVCLFVNKGFLFWILLGNVYVIWDYWKLGRISADSEVIGSRLLPSNGRKHVFPNPRIFVYEKTSNSWSIIGRNFIRLTWESGRKKFQGFGEKRIETNGIEEDDVYQCPTPLDRRFNSILVRNFNTDYVSIITRHKVWWAIKRIEGTNWDDSIRSWWCNWRLKYGTYNR